MTARRPQYSQLVAVWVTGVRTGAIVNLHGYCPRIRDRGSMLVVPAWVTTVAKRAADPATRRAVIQHRRRYGAWVCISCTAWERLRRFSTPLPAEAQAREVKVVFTEVGTGKAVLTIDRARIRDWRLERKIPPVYRSSVAPLSIAQDRFPTIIALEVETTSAEVVIAADFPRLFSRPPVSIPPRPVD